MEIDLYPRRHPQAMGMITARLGARSRFSREHGFFVDCVTPDLAAFPEGWTDRLTPFRTRRTGGVTGWCAELHDVATSKLAADRKKDLEYLKALLGAKPAKPRILEKRILTLPISSTRREAVLEVVRQLAPAVRVKSRARYPN
jgi:hypothetical protein